MFTNIVASNSETEINASDISTKIVIGSDNTNTANVTNENNTGVLNIVPKTSTTNNTVNNIVNNTANNVSKNISKYNVVNNTSSEDDIPHTGVEDTILYIIIALIVVSIVFYIKFERVNKEIR